MRIIITSELCSFTVSFFGSVFRGHITRDRKTLWSFIADLGMQGRQAQSLISVATAGVGPVSKKVTSTQCFLLV